MIKKKKPAEKETKENQRRIVKGLCYLMDNVISEIEPRGYRTESLDKKYENLMILLEIADGLDYFPKNKYQSYINKWHNIATEFRYIVERDLDIDPESELGKAVNKLEEKVKKQQILKKQYSR